MSSVVVEYVAIALTNAARHVEKLRVCVVEVTGTRARVLRSREGIVLILYELPSDQSRHDAIDHLRRQLVAKLADPTVSAGVAGPRRTAVGAYATALQAEQALLLSRPLTGPGRTTSFEELGPYSFILGQPLRDIRSYCDRMLGPLVDGETASESLIATLDMYIRCRNINAVGRTLGLHRNTVRKRLRRIAALTGADLSDADTRLAMHMAILGRRALDRMAKVRQGDPADELPISDLVSGHVLLGRAG